MTETEYRSRPEAAEPSGPWPKTRTIFLEMFGGDQLRCHFDKDSNLISIDVNNKWESPRTITAEMALQEPLLVGRKSARLKFNIED